MSDAIGAFMIGLVLAETPVAHRIERLVLPLRDAFAAVFFFAFGLTIDPSDAGKVIVPVLLAVVAVAGAEPDRRVDRGPDAAASVADAAANIGLTILGRGEFSLILATLAVDGRPRRAHRAVRRLLRADPRARRADPREPVAIPESVAAGTALPATGGRRSRVTAGRRAAGTSPRRIMSAWTRKRRCASPARTTEACSRHAGRTVVRRCHRSPARVDADGTVVISTRETAVKAKNVRRDPNVSLCVFADSFYGPWVQIDGTAEIVSLPEAMDGLVDYYRSISGEHPDWDDYRSRDADARSVASYASRSRPPVRT